jgi:hypothetical protein
LIYVFDNASISRLKHYFPGVFTSVWKGLDEMVATGQLISTREVFNELQNGVPDKHVDSWVKVNKAIFRTPSPDELAKVSEILCIKHFQSLIGEKQRLTGTPVADPFVVAAAIVANATVVTEELAKPNAAKVPNVCNHFGVPHMNLEGFMAAQGWTF